MVVEAVVWLQKGMAVIEVLQLLRMVLVEESEEEIELSSQITDKAPKSGTVSKKKIVEKICVAKVQEEEVCIYLRPYTHQLITQSVILTVHNYLHKSMFLV